MRSRTGSAVPSPREARSPDARGPGAPVASDRIAAHDATGFRGTPSRRAAGANLAGDRRIRRRHDDRVVRLLHLRKSRHGDLAAVLPARQRHPRPDRLPLDVCRRLRRPSVRRAVLRAHRRPRRPQARVPRHADDHGRSDRADRLSADLRDDRDRRADRAAGHPRPAGAGARRRVRRGRGLCRRARPGPPPRLLHQLHPDHGDARAVRLAGRHPDGAEPDDPGRLLFLGLAHSRSSFPSSWSACRSTSGCACASRRSSSTSRRRA